MTHEQPATQVVHVEEVDAVIVADAHALPARRTAGQIARTQAAVGAASFVAGAATAVVVAQRRAKRSAARRGRRPKAIDVAASRSFLVDVHLLNKRP